mgnify:CR=1 FL=1
MDAYIRFDSGKVAPVQITVAFPKWWQPHPAGYQHHLMFKALRQDGVLAGNGPFERDGQRIVSLSSREVFSHEEELNACTQGLEIAFESKALVSDPGILMIYARSFYENTMEKGDFDRVITASMAGVKQPRFGSIAIFSDASHQFAEYCPLPSESEKGR